MLEGGEKEAAQETLTWDGRGKASKDHTGMTASPSPSAVPAACVLSLSKT